MKRDRTGAVALIPARSGSSRLPDKNVRLLAGQPLIAYTIAAALDSEVFDNVIVSTDSENYAKVARHYGAEAPFLRPGSISGPTSPDIEWVVHALDMLADSGRQYEYFSILRPTSPFRTAKTICRAWKIFRSVAGVDSIRAVEKCSQHPGKMWVVRGRYMTPLLPLSPEDNPWHSSQYQSLPEVYVQNASLEIAHVRVVREERTIAGDVLMPFFTEEYEGLDINEARDWWYAEYLIAKGEAELPEVGNELLHGSS